MSRFELYQVKEGAEYAALRFEDSADAAARGMRVEMASYDLVWTGDLGAGRPFANVIGSLNRIYGKFNSDHPEGYAGRSASVSDVIAIEQGGIRRAWYVESIGYTEVPGFFG